MPRRTTALLGAGASVDARLPVSSKLTEALSRDLDERASRELALALRMVVGSIIAHDSRLGSSPYAGVDVERAFSAIKMLSERPIVEVAPFVSAWTDASFGAGDGRLPAVWGRDLERALRKSDNGASVNKVFTARVEALLGSPASSLYRGLMRAMQEGLIRLLSVDDPDRFDYLHPLLRGDDLSIATLNYDLGVELAGQSAGVEVDRGIESWTGGFDWTWNGRGLRLLKLHGSIDWRTGEPSAQGRFTPVKPQVALVPDSPLGWGESPTIVFGARDKLRADGPFLAMLLEFDRWLHETDDLVIVGYSFRDHHINAVLQHWLGSLDGRTLTIVDPGFPPGDQPLDGYSEFIRWLVRMMHPDGPQREQPNGELVVRPELATSFRIFRAGAAVALPEVMAGLNGYE